jgi:hypothetical protein
VDLLDGYSAEIPMANLQNRQRKAKIRMYIISVFRVQLLQFNYFKVIAISIPPEWVDAFILAFRRS